MTHPLDNSTDAPYGLKWRDKQHYISWMRERLIECRRVLKSTGSIYLHCDYHSNAHLRLLMDNIFGVDNFRNEIIWHYRTGNIGKHQFQRKHDTIFFYSNNQRNIFNFQEIKEYYTKLYGSQFKSSFKGRKYGKDKYGEYLISIVDDVWDISAVFTLGKEHMFYPSQKPIKLLKRIIEASSNRDDIILDPMCGSGTTT